ncbi:MAG: hypothetical protein HY445_02530 [Candidatus Niyogibacteria bacterium]|nr:hypothetical protein [Candidatus Niyogibacteria bacterium]
MSKEEYKPFGIGMNPENMPKTPEEIEKFWNLMKPLFESFKVPDGEAKTKNAIAEAKKRGFRPGTKAKLTHENEVGEVIGYNETADGPYPGSRYPILIKFKRGTYEYDLDQLELIKEK